MRKITQTEPGEFSQFPYLTPLIVTLKELIAWVRNNWRPEPTTKFVNPNLKITAINVVWDLHKDLVEEELRQILGVHIVEGGDTNIFTPRHCATKRLIF